MQSSLRFLFCFFFFQAEDGIRDWSVTGVQTCALPICLQELLEIAKAARLRSIAPFSNFLVGAAIKTDEGKVYIGCNVESASYGLTVCEIGRASCRERV